MQVLKLSNGYEPVEIISWQEAIRLIFLEKAEIVKQYDGKFIRTVSKTFSMPSVIKLSVPFARFRKKVKFSRKNVFVRDGHRCQYCGNVYSVSRLTLDHVVPRSLGGLSSWNNLVTCCVECNKKKANKTLEQSGMKLLSTPGAPNWLPTNLYSSKEFVPKEWLDYLK